MNKVILLLTLFLMSLYAGAQVTFPVNGVQDKNQVWYAFTNVTLHTDYKTTVEKATLLVRKGKVIEAGKNVKIPKGAVVYDLQGKHIYPSLIDIYSDYGMPEQEKKKKKQKPQFISEKKGSYSWNEAIHPETNAADQFSINKTQAKNLRKLGFGSVLTHQQDGIARGTSAFVTLGESRENEVALKGKAAAHYSFSKGTSSQDNPSSLMGAIALLRQTFYDSEWYGQKNGREEYNISLEAFNKQQQLPQIFEVQDYLTALRASKMGEEFDVQYIIKGNGDEYKRLDDLKEAAAAFIIPLGFPQAYDVEDPYDAMLVSLEDMKHWELAPANPAFLDSAGIPFAFTITGLEDKKDFTKNIQKMTRYGLADSILLKAFTYTPARLLGMQDTIGSLRPGMLANFLITSDVLFQKNTIIYENWVQGKPFILEDKDLLDIRGEYSLNVNSVVYDLEVSGKPDKPKGKLNTAEKDKKIKVEINQENKLIGLYFELNDDDFKGYIRLSGKINYQSASWDGQAQLSDGKWVPWSAIRKNKAKGETEKDTAKADSAALGKVFYPNMAYGHETKPVQEDMLIKNVTLWTNEEEGILKNADVLIKAGKIVKVETGMEPPLDKDGNLLVKVINGTGKHLTPGIIDEHSHIAISRGVNEGTQSVSAEVSIAHVVNSDDINIYRQLAGGVTAAQLLHGSANAVGGQSALVKLRWGQNADSMNIKGSDGFIKFALGENVKQSNWGDNQTERYPQTRMGVEQVFYDAFIRAKEYKQGWEEYNSLKKKKKEKTHPPRKDLELEALAEIMDKKRFISCHSYVQSEINMLMHVADSMGFTVNTFTHILEGYKVADKMKKHGAGGSTFSDWWAYKFEVNDAIPYNGALMHEQGIVTAFNSDDAEMGRRLNQEAAKAVKYGGVSEEEALKFVTLNPAKLLHLDHRMGSIKAGKDADLVIWSDHPLSIYAKVEKTFIDGICYYDAERDKKLREAIAAERGRIIAKMIKAKNNGEKTKKPENKEEKHYHCDSIEDEG